MGYGRNALGRGAGGLSATCKWLYSSHLAIFRVVVLPTLKTPKTVIFSDLYVAPNSFSLSLTQQQSSLEINCFFRR